MKLTRIALGMLTVALMNMPAQAQDTWTWNKAVAAGKRIEIKGVNGDISATAATGSQVEVIAKKERAAQQYG